jgi:hypothetical protein
MKSNGAVLSGSSGQIGKACGQRDWGSRAVLIGGLWQERTGGYRVGLSSDAVNALAGRRVRFTDNFTIF